MVSLSIANLGTPNKRPEMIVYNIRSTASTFHQIFFMFNLYGLFNDQRVLVYNTQPVGL